MKERVRPWASVGTRPVPQGGKISKGVMKRESSARTLCNGGYPLSEMGEDSFQRHG